MWNIAIINAMTNDGKTHMPSIVILLSFSAFLILVKGITRIACNSSGVI